MELRHIRYFLAVAQERNFTRAAEKLCIAQPPLSRQIHELEEELGAPLFLRKPHNLELTEEGEVFFEYATRILDLANKSAQDIRELKKGLQGTLFFAIVEGHAPELISEWICEFQKQHPHICYNLWNGNSDEVINRLTKGLCEFAIIMEPHNAEGVFSIPVYKEPWIAMIPSAHPLASLPGTTIEPRNLAGCDLIIPSRDTRLSEIKSWFSSTGETPIIRCRIAHMLNAYALTSKGVGITIFPASANLGISSDVCVKQLVNPSASADYILIWSKNRQLSNAGEEFLRYIQKRYE